VTASLHRRVILILLALTLVTWLVSVVLTAALARQMLLRQIERQLIQSMDMAHQSVALVVSEPEFNRRDWKSQRILSSGPGFTRVSGFGTQGREQALNLWFERSQVLVGEVAPQYPEPEREGFITWQQNEENNTSSWRVLYRRDSERGIWLAIGVDLDNASSVGAVTLIRAILPLLVILPLTVPILLWGVRRGLRPLDRLAEKIEARKPQLLEPIDTDDVPLEIKPVVIALNGLLDRLQRALVSESRFTANAAHELQTPLAAIKAEVQRHQTRAADNGSSQMLERISTRVSRATNTVTQLLTLARLDPEQEFQRAQVNLQEIVIEAVAEEGGTAMDRSLDVRVPEVPEVPIEGHPDWLKILVRNLVANAFRHSPAQGVVDISLERRPGYVQLRVCNDCPPIPPEQRRQLIDRFYTLPGNSAGGAGLGLSIVARIAELHGADLQLDSWRGAGGFAVRVDFPTGQAEAQPW
jgi:signal transduction histidine kinase